MNKISNELRGKDRFFYFDIGDKIVLDFLYHYKIHHKFV
jgi:hypothetical protein